MNLLIEWINNLLMPTEPTENVFKFSNLNKCVVSKTFLEMNQNYGTNCRMTIAHCEESNIYIDSNVDLLLVTSCINCTIFVAAVNRVCTFEKCENVTICVTSQ